jgi:hypothetical protein
MTQDGQSIDVLTPVTLYKTWAHKVCENAQTSDDYTPSQMLNSVDLMASEVENGLGSEDAGNRRTHFRAARRSALECQALQDILMMELGSSAKESVDPTQLIEEIISGLTKLREMECHFAA